MKNLKRAFLGTLLVGTTMSASWEDVLQGLEPGTSIRDDGSSHSVSLYNSTITYTVNNNDGISGNFSDEDTAIITLTSANGTVITSGSTALTKEELKTWAKSNANSIVDVIFQGDPVATLGGQNSGTVTASNVSTLITNATKKARKDGLFKNYESKILMGSEKVDIDDDGRSITGSAGYFSFTDDTDGGNEWGTLIAYRDTKADDTFSSETKSLSFVPFWKFGFSAGESFEIPLIINLTTNIMYIKASLFPDGGGYFEYGGGIGTTPTYKVTDFFSVNLNLSYQYLEKYIPSSYVPEDAEWIADAINNLKPLQVASYGLGMTFFITDGWNLTLDALEIKQLETDDISEGRDKATYYTTTTNYETESWLFSLGYKTVKGVKEYEEDSYMASVSYKW